VAADKKKALETPKTSNTNASAAEGEGGAGGEARTSRNPTQLKVNKRKAEEVYSTYYPSEPASHRPTSRHLIVDGPESQGTTGELSAHISQQLGPTEDGLAYAMVVAGVISLQ
jgi:cytoskeletal protein RodZ